MDRSRVLPCYYGQPNSDLYSGITLSYTYPNYDRITSKDVEANYAYYSLRGTYHAGSAVTSGYEHIVDADLSRRDAFNRCYHTKSMSRNLPFALQLKHSTYVNRGVIIPFKRFIMANYYVDPPKLMLEAVSTDQFRSRAYASMQPRFAGKVSLINTLFELKDFRDIAKHLLKNMSSLDALMGLTGGAAQRRAKRSGFPKIKDPTAIAAEIGLAYNFAVVPTLKDISGILSQMQAIVSAKQLEFQQRGLEVCTSHYSEYTIHEDTRAVPTSGDYFWFKSGKLVKTKSTATLQYKYDYLVRSPAEAFRKYWGLTGNLEAFWNMIPFSFLLDYVLRIGQAIHFAERDVNVSMHLHKYGESYKTTIAYGSWFNCPHSRFDRAIVNGSLIDTSQPYDTQIMGQSASAYLRYPATPFRGLIVPRLKSPSDLQIFNIAALARCMFS